MIETLDKLDPTPDALKGLFDEALPKPEVPTDDAAGSESDEATDGGGDLPVSSDEAAPVDPAPPRVKPSPFARS